MYVPHPVMTNFEPTGAGFEIVHEIFMALPTLKTSPLFGERTVMTGRAGTVEVEVIESVTVEVAVVEVAIESFPCSTDAECFFATDQPIRTSMMTITIPQIMLFDLELFILLVQ